MLAHEIIVREVKANSRAVVLSLLAESIGQARKAAHPHPHGQVLAFYKAGLNVLLIGITRHNVALGSDNLRRTVPSGSDRLGFVKFNALAEINIHTERIIYGVNVASESVSGDLDPTGQALGKILHEDGRVFLRPLSDAVAGHQLGIGVQGHESPHIANLRTVVGRLQEPLMLADIDQISST